MDAPLGGGPGGWWRGTAVGCGDDGGGDGFGVMEVWRREWHRGSDRSGLKLSLQRELLVSKPTTLGDAFSLSRVTEARLGDQTSTTIVPKVNHRSGSQCQRPTAAIVPKVTSVAKPSHLRWTRGHKCPGKFLLLMTDNDEDTGEEVTVAEEESIESGDISILNSLVGHGSPRSLQLWGKIGDTMEHILIDNGSTHNFIRPDVVERLRDEEGHGVANNSTSSRHPEIEQPLIRYDSLFQVPTCLPPNHAIDHRIHLLPNTKPVNVRPYRYPHYQKGEMEKLVTEMLGQGIIRFSHSPFLSPVLLVKKKDGSYRFCVDYRALNAMMVKDKFLFPTADEMFDGLGGASIFTKLDLRAGYHQIRVHERDVYKTAFCTHDGHYEFLVMPFGLTNAPSTFQVTMNRLFFPYLRKFVIVFFDDILRSKCVFGAGELEYLRHVISARGVNMDPKKLLAVRDWPEPKNQRHVRGFLGLAGYYRHFIRGYASLTAPLSDLLKHEGFKWGKEESKAFQIFKERLSNAPLLSLPNFEQVFMIEADVSEDGIRAVLMQENRSISYFSLKLGQRMRVAATYQKELFAIVEAIYKWRRSLLGRRFTIRTDHKSIKELMQQVIQMPLQQKYVRKLMGFDFSIEYKPRATNKAVDALSRMFKEDQQLTASFMALRVKTQDLVTTDFIRKSTISVGGMGSWDKKTLVGLYGLCFLEGGMRTIDGIGEFIKKCVSLSFCSDCYATYINSTEITWTGIFVARAGFGLTQLSSLGADWPTSFQRHKGSQPEEDTGNGCLNFKAVIYYNLEDQGLFLNM
ncbi:ty3-gypsy retrotransposon protein [Tanacetum coccineum]